MKRVIKRILDILQIIIAVLFTIEMIIATVIELGNIPLEKFANFTSSIGIALTGDQWFWIFHIILALMIGIYWIRHKFFEDERSEL